MKSTVMNRLRQLSLAQQFLVVNLVVLVLGMAAVGWWVGEQIKAGVIDYSAATTALYVDSFVAPHVQQLAEDDNLASEQVQQLDSLLRDTALGQEIVAFKIWGANGHLVYATDQALVGQVFPVHEQLFRAWQGHVAAEISDLQAAENVLERERATQLLETYSPVRQTGSNQVIAVAEFYQPIDDLQTEIFAAQFRSWLLVGLVMVVMYLLLAGIVKPASDVITRQEAELRQKVACLTTILAQNKELDERVRRAATRTTALNERFLRRISAELHDGPGQDMALALLRIESLAEAHDRYLLSSPNNGRVANDFRTVQAALESALTDLRTISAGLRLPKIETLPVVEVIRRAVQDYKRKTISQVTLEMVGLPDEAPLPVKITLYRVLQEALGNSYRHAGGQEQAVRVQASGAEICLEVADAGPGFDPARVTPEGHFGLVGMRERVEMLGGRFEIDSRPACGTTIRTYLPLTMLESV